MINRVLISVLMSVYNTTDNWLKEAIDSILNQTFENFEFIIIDDKSTDGSAEILKDYKEKDPRVVLLENEENIGLTKSLNKGLQIAKGKYIARMDADDVAVPDRLAVQFAYMEQHPEVAVTGGYLYTGSDTPGFLTGYQDDMERMKIRMLFGNAGVAHPSAMIRKAFLTENGIQYDERLKKSQDYGLWIDCVRNGGKIQMLKKVLIRYRVHDGQISAQRSNQMGYAMLAMGELLEALLPDHTQEQLAFHSDLLAQLPTGEKEQYTTYLDTLKAANQERGVYPKKLFQNALKAIWLHLCEYRLRHMKKWDFLCSKNTVRCITFGGLKMYYHFFVQNKAACRRAIMDYLNVKGLSK